MKLLLLCLLVGVIVSCSFENVRHLSKSESSKTEKLMPFEEIKVNAAPVVWKKEVHPFLGATPIDIDGDGIMEIFVGGGDGQEDLLLSYKNNELVNIIAGTQLSDTKATHGANSIDLDNDGDTDLLLARNDGVYLYLNNNGVFAKKKIELSAPSNSTPLNVAVGDIDKDGDGDLYVSFFVDFKNFKSATYNVPEHAKTNLLLLNNGNLTFSDITESSNTASLQNTFLSSFIDLDGDSWLDLIVAQNTGQVEIFRNLKNNTFESVGVKTGWGFWMGLTAGDIDKDGDQDLFFSNVGNSIPKFLLELGDARDDQPRNYGWILLRNDGDFKLENITNEYELDDYGFAWGVAFEDLRLDGELELLVAQNYIKWIFHKWSKLSGKSFVLSDEAFYHARGLGLETHTFAQSPLIVDINNDGKPDVFWLNMKGKHRAFINKTTNNFLTLMFSDNVLSIGAKAYIITADGKSYTRELHNNTGMSTDQMSALTFGLGEKTEVMQLVIEWQDGVKKIINNPSINKIIHINR